VSDAPSSTVLIRVSRGRTIVGQIRIHRAKLVPAKSPSGRPITKLPLCLAFWILARKLHCNQGSPMSASDFSVEELALKNWEKRNEIGHRHHQAFQTRRRPCGAVRDRRF